MRYSLNIFVLPMYKMNVFDLELTIRFESPGHAGDAVYLIGSLNHWQKEGMLLGHIPDQGVLHVLLKDVPEGLLEFRLSRGGWSAVSCRMDGTLDAPFTIDIKANTSAEVAVAAWSDDFALSAVTEQVHWLREAFFFPELNVFRKIWIYLPESYVYSGIKRYPVLYMHDGQHLFDNAPSAGRKGSVDWQVDKAINRSVNEAIVIGIAHGGEESDRLHDYTVQPVQGMPAPAGREYLSDIIHTLKPFVDAHYRTMPGWKYTAMAGSSLGGLLSLYAGLMHPQHFACLGVFSPSLWLDDRQVNTFIDMLQVTAKALQPKQSYYLYGGGLENRKIKDRAPVEMDKDITQIGGILSAGLQANVHLAINPEGKHGTLYWQQAFPHFYEWWWQQMQ